MPEIISFQNTSKQDPLFCIYSGRHFLPNEMDDEHVIPRSLGGTRDVVIRSLKRLNSKLGSEIDAKISSDAMVQFGRRDANARGNNRKVPTPVLKKAALWKRGQTLDSLEPRFNIEVPGGTKLVERYDTKTGKFLTPGIESDSGYIIKDFPINHQARVKFTVKTFLGMGWRMFGSAFQAAIDCDSLRAIIGVEGYTLAKDTRIRYHNPFFIGDDPDNQRVYKDFESQVVKRLVSTIYLVERDDFIEWTVSCLGYLVATIIVPTKTNLMSSMVPSDKGVLLTLTRYGLEQEMLEACA